ncbi:MAG: ABC transporter ATP-binding protein [Chloroflexota bacterium]|nr:ABC transporter ATP-binding protein [Chloroflexota bacterium]
MYIIQTAKLTKYYGKVRGIESLSLNIRPGEIFGFLGPNGAGKTTTIRILIDLIRPTCGHARIFGLDVQKHSVEIRKRIGNLPGDVSLYEHMTGDEFLNLMSSLHNNHSARRKRILAKRLDIDLSRRIKTYSKGMKQKVAIIQALMNDPELLILDEPTSGLDPLVQREFYNLLKNEQDRGKTVFFSSHILPEVERVCDRVGLLRNGILINVESIDDLKSKRVRKLELILKEAVAPERLHLPGVELTRIEGKHVEFIVHGHIGELIPKLSNLPLEDVVFPEATLEDTFMKFYSEEEEA